MKDLTKIGIKELERLVESERNKVNNLFKSAKKSLGPLSPFSETIIDFEMSKGSKNNDIVNFQPKEDDIKRMNLIQEYHQLQATKQKLMDVASLKSEAKFNKKITKEYLSKHLKIKVSDTGVLKFRNIINNAKADNALSFKDINEVFQQAKSMGYSDEAYQLLDEEDAAERIRELLNKEDVSIEELEALEPDDDFGF